MHRTHPELETATGEGFTLVRLPYDAERFGMEVLRPDEDLPWDELLVELGIVSAFGVGDCTPLSTANPEPDTVHDPRS